MDSYPEPDKIRALPPMPSSPPPPNEIYPDPNLPSLPTSPTSSEPRPKKPNPLHDLIETEKTYVEQLTAIIRKIAAAWSRSNLPPPELDTMFRCIEAIYKANKTLVSKLTEIGTNPSSPKALGDLLMRWIDDLEAPYTNYCSKYCCGFDDWEPVKSNRKLPDILVGFSTSNPPASSESSTWTLDTLFLLPKARLKYYRKLYNRLLKGTVAGRSDHRLLLGALEKLDTLLAMVESRQDSRVGRSRIESPAAVAELGGGEVEDEVVVDMRTQSVFSPVQVPIESNRNSAANEISHGKENGSEENHENGLISRKGSNATFKMPIMELERRLSAERTMDLFTMSPKAVRLQIQPLHLTFTREMRLSLGVLIRFTPTATNVEVTHQMGHVFLLSDLLLVCERMSSQEQAQRGPDGPDMWLCYPPLAGKVLRISEAQEQPHVLQVAVMKKEFLTIETDSVNTRNALMRHLKDCIEFSGSLPPLSKDPPPPMPPMPPPRVSGGNITSLIPNRSQSQPAPSVGDPLLRMPQDVQRQGMPVNEMSNLAIGPGAQLHQGAQRLPTFHPIAGPVHPRSTSFQPQGPQPRVSINAGFPPQNSNYMNPRAPPYPVPMPFNHHHAIRPGTVPGPYPPDGPPPRPPSDPAMTYGTVRKSSSMHSLASQYTLRERPAPQPPMPDYAVDRGGNGINPIPRTGSAGNLRTAHLRPLLPSAQMKTRAFSAAGPSFDEPSPPGSPTQETKPALGPVTSAVISETKCKVFLQQQHSQWKSLGSAKLKLYHQNPTNVKQLVVGSNKTILISTIVLTDGVERVGKTGIAIELSDKGARTGVIYMLQLQNESSAAKLYNDLLVGSDRSG